MKVLFFVILSFWIIANTHSFVFAKEKKKEKKPYLTTHFQWEAPSENIYPLLRPEDGFRLESGKFVITGKKDYEKQGKELLAFLKKAYVDLQILYKFSPGEQSVWIPLMSEKEANQHSFNIPVETREKFQLTFPFPIPKQINTKTTTTMDTSTEKVSVESAQNTADNSFFQSFATMQLFHVLFKADLAFGNSRRMPVSAHAYRFADGLAGFMALEVMKNIGQIDQNSLLHILDVQSVKKAVSDQYSSEQILTQNRGAQHTRSMEGFNQFMAGVNLSRDNESGKELYDPSSASDRIRVFQMIQKNYGTEGIEKIFEYMRRSSKVWGVDDPEDSFCAKYIKFGCHEPTIDGSRSDIILYFITQAKFSELLAKVEEEKEEKPISFEEELPPYPVYGFNFPKEGGANEGTFDLLYRRDRTWITSRGILKDEELYLGGGILGFGLQDEAYRMSIEISYRFGEKRIDEEITVSNVDYTLPTKITLENLKGGAKTIERGKYTKWVSETGINFRWTRFTIEWDTSDLSFKKTDTEYVFRNYYLVEVQNYWARKFGGVLDFGFNTDFQLGIVTHSGSTLIARSERFNVNTSQGFLGATLGPEIRLEMPAIAFELRIGSSFEYLWQPFPTDGGTKENDDTVDATQQTTGVYGVIGFSF